MSAPDGPQGDSLLLGASRRLVAWVAAGRTADEQMSAVEAALAHWVRLAEDDDAAPEAIVDTLESYVEAWHAATRTLLIVDVESLARQVRSTSDRTPTL